MIEPFWKNSSRHEPSNISQKRSVKVVLKGSKYTSGSGSFFPYDFDLITKATSFKFNIFVKKAKSHHRGCSIWKAALEKFAKLTGKHLCRSPFFNEVADLSNFLSKATLTI